MDLDNYLERISKVKKKKKATDSKRILTFNKQTEEKVPLKITKN